MVLKSDMLRVINLHFFTMAKPTYNQTANSTIYGLGFIGAAIYFVTTASTFWIGVLGILKAAVWPAFLVYELFKFLLG